MSGDIDAPVDGWPEVLTITATPDDIAAGLVQVWTEGLTEDTRECLSHWETSALRFLIAEAFEGRITMPREEETE